MRTSLCIVARNEATFLADAIESARPVVDEVVIVDTGSSDGTPEIARAAGARVFEAEWPGDLGTAHALPVAHARGDWILALDADEVLDPESRSEIRDLVASDEFEAYTLPIRNYQYGWPFTKWRPADPRDPLTSGAGGYIPTKPVRLFRRRREYVYSGRLHQTVAPAILQAGGRIGHAEAIIHHYGFLRYDRDKSDLYERLARRHARESPDDPRAWIDLGVVLADRGRHAAAADAFRRARGLGNCVDASFHLGCTLVTLGHTADGAALLRESIRHNPHDSAPFYDRADAYELLALGLEDDDRALLAEAAYRSALRLRPDSPLALNNLAALLGKRGDLGAAERLVERLVSTYPGSSTSWSALGLLRLRQRELEPARQALETALSVWPGNVAALMNLGLTHARAGRPRKAAHAYTSAQEWFDDEAALRRLADCVPRRHRRRPRPLPTYGADLVVGVIERLEGGAGRVFVDGMVAIADRPRLVLCRDTGAYNGLGLRAELEAAGVDVLPVPSHSLQLVLDRVAPSLVLHHWWRQSYLREPLRVADERWICVGHVALPLPFGYDAYVTLSAYQRRVQTHLPADRVAHIPNGVDVTRFDKRPRGTPDPVSIVMLSRLEPSKFPRRLPEYLPPLDHAQVLIAGIGGRRYELEPELAAGGFGGRVRFLGSVASADVPHLLARADIGLHLTELSEESWGMSVHEMLAAGLPVVAEPKGNLPELIVSGQNGYLAEKPAEIAERLRELIESPTLRLRMGAESRRVASRFDIVRFRAAMRELVTKVERREPLMPVDRRGLPFAPPDRRARTRRNGFRFDWTPTVSVLICATPRCGSSLLCEALLGTGLAGQPEEYFNPVSMRKHASRWNTRELEAYLSELFERTSTPNGVFAAKLMPQQFSALLGGLRERWARPGSRDGELLTAAFPALRFVWVTRDDKLRQAISWERANQSGEWGRTGVALPIALPRPRFDRAAIARLLRVIDERETRWQRVFASAGIEPVRVRYEEVVADYEGTARRALAELGIEIPTDLLLAPRRLLRQADATSERWVERFSYPTKAASRSATPAQTTAVS